MILQIKALVPFEAQSRIATALKRSTALEAKNIRVEVDWSYG
tara:strand:- start:3011 stop:3136 length:126 start_codon:yes stop_codon:yes gene_type:complete